MAVKAEKLSRRELLGLFLSSGKVLLPLDKIEVLEGGLLRPPGAAEPGIFITACQRCGRCVDSCPRSLLVPAGTEYGVAVGTPRVDFNLGYCDFCMDCAAACPSGALKPVKPGEARLGCAEVNQAACLAWKGTLCNDCYFSCLHRGKAIKITAEGKPEIDPRHCTGCGICRQACQRRPAAIGVVALKV